MIGNNLIFSNVKGVLCKIAARFCKMFSFRLGNRNDERYVPPHAYLVKEEFDPEKVQQDAEGRQAMDDKDDDNEDAPFQQFQFPVETLAYQCFVAPAPQPLYFKRELIPPTLLPLNPGQLEGLESIDAITADQKFTLGVYMALPMPVHRSPIITLFLDNVPPKATPPRKDRYMTWWQSAYQLRSIAFLAYMAAVPYHSSVKNAYPRQCYDEEFVPQIAAYEELHRERVEELIDSSPPPNGGGREPPSLESLQRFVAYAEDFALYYLHSLERYLFKVLIEPHLPANSPLTLAHFLTPRVESTLSQCENVARAQRCVVDFFAFHVAATHEHERRHAGDDYGGPRNPIQLADIPRRLATTPPNELHRGYLDRQTALEYWMFCDLR